MRDVTADVVQTPHQILDACEHAIESFGQPAELVMRTDHGNAPRKIAVHNGSRRAIDGIDPLEQHRTALERR